MTTRSIIDRSSLTLFTVIELGLALGVLGCARSRTFAQPTVRHRSAAVHRVIAPSQCPPGFLFVPAGRLNIPGSGPPKVREVAAFCLQRDEVESGAYIQCQDNGQCTEQRPDEMTFTPEPEPSLSHSCWDINTDPHHPVRCVTWRAASGYCASIGARLPTIDQWWRAAVGDTTRTNLGSGRSLSTSIACTGFIGDQSPFGHRALAGNVAEWIDACANSKDGWTTSALTKSTQCSGSGEANEPVPLYVGGSFEGQSKRALEVGTAFVGSYDIALTHVGFRCAAAPLTHEAH